MIIYFFIYNTNINFIIPVLKIANQKTTKNIPAALSSDVSSSVSGNMDLIQYQINKKSNDYINVKNAVRIFRTIF